MEMVKVVELWIHFDGWALRFLFDKLGLQCERETESKMTSQFFFADP